MATKLRRNVVREALHTSEQGRPIIVAFEPHECGDFLAFRLKGLRRWYRLPVAAGLWLAVRNESREHGPRKRRRSARRDRGS